MNVDDVVRGYYGRDGLEATVFGALRDAGVDVEALKVEDLGGLDQLHAGFGPATEYVLERISLRNDSALLDVGCGVGGPARVAAARYGCQVTALDLSPDFIALARTLTERVGLADKVTFDVGSATDMPYADATFDGAMLIHAGMNIADKAGVFGQVRRVLKTGGRFAVYEQMRLADGDLAYPMPWADDETSSFVETRERYAELLTEAGFTVEHDEDRTAANGPPPPGGLTPAGLFGPGFGERMGNNIAAAMGGVLGAVLIVARAA